MDRDRNLLFGIFAVQLKRVTPTQLVDVAAAWATDTSKAIPERLIEAGILSASDRDFLNEVVDKAIQAHNGDTAGTLRSFGGEEEVYHTFRGSIVLTGSGGVSRAEDQPTRLAEVTPDQVPGVQEAPGRYSHVSEYGRGGMGRVLLVHDQHLGRDIALKELLPEPDSTAKPDLPSPVRLSVPVVARFLQEARVTGQLEHPSIVPVYELGYRKDGTLYYTMKLVRGKTLAQAIREASTLRERVALLPHFVDLCHAIAYAHSRGVIHRDIKPGNVMVGEFGETVVLDWGIAKARGQHDVHAEQMEKASRALFLGKEADQVATAYGRPIGTPAYMPPEQAQGEIDSVDERSDVYSLGAVLYEIMTGQPPFTGETLHEIVRKVTEQPPKLILQIEPAAPPELAAICECAMQKDQGARYGSAKELAAEVERFLSGALVMAYQYGIVEHLGRTIRKHKASATALTVGILVFLVVGAFSYGHLARARRETEAAQREKEKEKVTAQNLQALVKVLEERLAETLQVASRGLGGLGRTPATKARVFIQTLLREPLAENTLGAEFVRTVHAVLEAKVVETGRFEVMDASEVTEMLRQFQMSPSELNDPKLWLRLGSNSPEVRRLRPQFVVFAIPYLRSDGVEILIRLMSVETGRIIASHTAEYTFRAPLEAKPLEDFARLVASMLDLEWPRTIGIVEHVASDHLTAYFGYSPRLLKPGMFAWIPGQVAPAEVDPQTGEVLTAPIYDVLIENLYVEEGDGYRCVIKPNDPDDPAWKEVKAGMLIVTN